MPKKRRALYTPRTRKQREARKKAQKAKEEERAKCQIPLDLYEIVKIMFYKFIEEQEADDSIQLVDDPKKEPKNPQVPRLKWYEEPDFIYKKYRLIVQGLQKSLTDDDKEEKRKRTAEDFLQRKLWREIEIDEEEEHSDGVEIQGTKTEKGFDDNIRFATVELKVTKELASIFVQTQGGIKCKWVIKKEGRNTNYVDKYCEFVAKILKNPITNIIISAFGEGLSYKLLQSLWNSIENMGPLSIRNISFELDDLSSKINYVMGRLRTRVCNSVHIFLTLPFAFGSNGDSGQVQTWEEYKDQTFDTQRLMLGYHSSVTFLIPRNRNWIKECLLGYINRAAECDNFKEATLVMAHDIRPLTPVLQEYTNEIIQFLKESRQFILMEHNGRLFFFQHRPLEKRPPTGREFLKIEVTLEAIFIGTHDV